MRLAYGKEIVSLESSRSVAYCSSDLCIPSIRLEKAGEGKVPEEIRLVFRDKNFRTIKAANKLLRKGLDGLSSACFYAHVPTW